MKRLAFALVLSLAAGWGAFRFWQYQERPHTKRCVESERRLTTALNWYAVDNDGFPPPSTRHLIPLYLKSIPECDQPYDYEVVGRNYTVSCHGGHRAFRMPPGYPKMATGKEPGKYLMLRP